jgi:tyrosinase
MPITHQEVSPDISLDRIFKSTCNSLIFCTPDPLFYLHHGNLDRILWEWQSKDLAIRLNQVGGPVTPFDYGGRNVTLDFEVNIGALAGNTSLLDLLNPVGTTLCYTYQ